MEAPQSAQPHEGDNGSETQPPGGGQPCPPSFEQALEQLEHLVHQLEEGDIGLAEALDHYEKGIGLLKQCYGLLERAERRIELLSGIDAAGNPITEPFADDGEQSLEEKSQNRGRRAKPAGAKQAGHKAKPNSAEIAESAQTRMDATGGLF